MSKSLCSAPQSIRCRERSGRAARRLLPVGRRLVTKYVYDGPLACRFPADQWRPGCPTEEHSATGIKRLSYDEGGDLRRIEEEYAKGPYTYEPDGSVTEEYGEYTRHGQEIRIRTKETNFIGRKVYLDEKGRPVRREDLMIEGPGKGELLNTTVWKYEGDRLIEATHSFTNEVDSFDRECE